ncbi:unnamed protein product [Closterium sp. Naga37s-1]|nr:unnamed protein product [Closterium sp. Naga37s-1]
MTLRGDGRRPDEKLRGDGRRPDEKLQGDGRQPDEKLQDDGRRPDEEKKGDETVRRKRARTTRTRHRKRRVLIDLGGRFFNSSVTWFLQSYPLDFTEIHAVEVRQGVFQVPAPSHKTIRANMSYRSRLRPLHTGPADFPPWLLARVHSHRFMASAIDNAGKNIVNVTRWLLEELQVTPEDTVVVKMDIEGSEWDIFQAWLDSPLMPRVIDELFVEVHYNHPSMHFFTWTPRNFPHSRQQAGQLLNAMRSAGYYVHAWP